MLSASDDVLNQFNCTDSSGEDVGNPPTNQKFAYPSLGKFTLLFFTIPLFKFPQQNYPFLQLEGVPPTTDVLREFWEHRYQQAGVLLETEDSNQKIWKSDSIFA